MIIQWFPGHMNKALKVLEEQLKIVDVVIYVLDARAPFSCLNPEFSKRVFKKPIIYVLNKCDLIEQKTANRFKENFTGENSSCIILNSLATQSAKVLIPEIEKLTKDKVEKYAKKGVQVTVRAIVIGVPNCGKSTLINNLCGKYKAITGNKAGVTRGKQWVKINEHVEVLDMPGTLWPSFNDNKVAHNLAYIGSIRDEVVEKTELCFDFIKDLIAIKPQSLKERYNINFDESDEVIDVYHKICESRNYFLRKGEYDYDRCANAVIDDFRKGKLGKICLEEKWTIK